MDEFMIALLTMVLLVWSACAIGVGLVFRRKISERKYFYRYFDFLEELSNAVFENYTHLAKRKPWGYATNVREMIPNGYYYMGERFSEMLCRKNDATSLFRWKHLYYLGVVGPSQPQIGTVKYSLFMTYRKRAKQFKVGGNDQNRYPVGYLPIVAALRQGDIAAGKISARRLSKEALSGILSRRASRKSGLNTGPPDA